MKALELGMGRIEPGVGSLELGPKPGVRKVKSIKGKFTVCVVSHGRHD